MARLGWGTYCPKIFNASASLSLARSEWVVFMSGKVASRRVSTLIYHIFGDSRVTTEFLSIELETYQLISGEAN
jgi:hypothetical protein